MSRKFTGLGGGDRAYPVCGFTDLAKFSRISRPPAERGN